MIKGGFFMKSNRKQGFTLIELIVVIAIIGVLAAILIPSLIGYIRKSKRTTDLSTARNVYEGVLATIAGDEDLVDSFSNSNNTTFAATVKTAAGTESYTGYIVCTKDGAANNGGNRSVWSGGSAQAQPFEKSLNIMLGEGRTPVKFVKAENGKELDRWFICSKDNTADTVEVWVGSGTNNTPMFRLWPNTSIDYK